MQYQFLRGLQRTAGQLQTRKFHFHIRKTLKPPKSKQIKFKGTSVEKISKASAKGNPDFSIYYNSERVNEHVSKSELIKTFKKP